MVRRSAKKFGLALAATAMVLSLTATVALAGEVTGSGKNSDQNQGRSWCSFSGLNDGVDGPTDSRSQSYGQDVKAGREDPHEANPGLYCNPNHTFLPPFPNRRP